MLTVKGFKDLGGDFVVGDSTSTTSGSVFFKSLCEDGVAYMNYGREAKPDSYVVKSFAWRPLNTLPDSPKFKYEKCIKGVFWRPLLDQSQTETKEEAAEAFDKMKPYDFDAHASEAKPVFTQAMADAKELPKVGAAVSYPTGKGELVLAADTNGICIVIEDGAYKRVGIDAIKPIDNRTPKQKAVDAALKIMGFSGGGNIEADLSKIYDLWNK